MNNLRRPALGLLFVMVAGLAVMVGPSAATIAKKVPIDGGNYSANDEGYLELDTHFTGGHVDMHVGSVCADQRILSAYTREFCPQVTREAL